jgi:hypothetical protein
VRRPALYLPLVFDPGIDAQVDWGEATVILQGEAVVVQLFIMRLCYSRKLFVMAFPTQRQEAFLLGHVLAFAHFGGVPHRISYDNLKVAVQQILEGRNRIEQTDFVRFRSHYLFESRFCTPAQGHEKGGVESDVGYSRRNFLVPPPAVADFAELNARLLAACRADDLRIVDRQTQTVGVRWQVEQPRLHPLPAHPFACCVSREVTLNGYGTGHLRDEPLFGAGGQSPQASHAARLSIHHRTPGRQPGDCHAPAQLRAPAGHSGPAPLSGAAGRATGRL